MSFPLEFLEPAHRSGTGETRGKELAPGSGLVMFLDTLRQCIRDRLLHGAAAAIVGKKKMKTSSSSPIKHRFPPFYVEFVSQSESDELSPQNRSQLRKERAIAWEGKEVDVTQGYKFLPTTREGDQAFVLPLSILSPFHIVVVILMGIEEEEGLSLLMECVQKALETQGKRNRKKRDLTIPPESSTSGKEEEEEEQEEEKFEPLSERAIGSLAKRMIDTDLMTFLPPSLAASDAFRAAQMTIGLHLMHDQQVSVLPVHLKSSTVYRTQRDTEKLQEQRIENARRLQLHRSRNLLFFQSWNRMSKTTTGEAFERLISRTVDMWEQSRQELAWSNSAWDLRNQDHLPIILKIRQRHERSIPLERTRLEKRTINETMGDGIFVRERVEEDFMHSAHPPCGGEPIYYMGVASASLIEYGDKIHEFTLTSGKREIHYWVDGRSLPNVRQGEPWTALINHLWGLDDDTEKIPSRLSRYFANAEFTVEGELRPLRPIEVGEQLTIDYGFAFWNDSLLEHQERSRPKMQWHFPDENTYEQTIRYVLDHVVDGLNWVKQRARVTMIHIAGATQGFSISLERFK